MKTNMAIRNNMSKLVALVLAVCLVMASTAGAYASEKNNHKELRYNADAYQRIEDVNIKDISDDISTLKITGFDEKDIIGVNINNDIKESKELKQTEKVVGEKIDTNHRNTFAYRLADDMVSEVTVLNETKDGGVVLDFVEGNLHNILFITNSGKMFLDGDPVEITAPDKSIEYGTLIPNYYVTHTWSTTPLSNTKSSDYTIFMKTFANGDVALTKTIQNIAATALGAIISIALAPVTGGISATAYGGIVGLIASSIKTLGEKVAPNTAHLSYKINEYGTPKSTNGCKLYRFHGTFYISKNYQGSSVVRDMYKRDQSTPK